MDGNCQIRTELVAENALELEIVVLGYGERKMQLKGAERIGLEGKKRFPCIGNINPADSDRRSGAIIEINKTIALVILLDGG